MSASALGRWPLIRGNVTLNCVGTLTKCPYTAGGRSRRGSPKAGTTVQLLHMAILTAILRMLPGEAENGVGMNRSVREGKKCEAL